MELIRTPSPRAARRAPRAARLSEYLSLLASGGANRDAFDRFRADIEAADAEDVNEALHLVLSGAADLDCWKAPVARFLHALSASLEARDLPSYPGNSLLCELDAENAAIESWLDSAKSAASGGSSEGSAHIRARSALGSVDALETHYERLQNSLFPLMERHAPHNACLRLMWSIQDETLDLARALGSHAPALQDEAFWKTFGSFMFMAKALCWRERRILYPVAFRAIPAAGTASTIAPSPATPSPAARSASASSYANIAFRSVTGSLSAVQMEAIFRALPVDIAFIGADDRVAFYSDPPHRIFPRAPQVIGRLVRDCHPPKSVAVVEEILRSFKNGERDRAEFWLEHEGAFIHIEYVPLRDAEGYYLGTLEVTHDATKLRALQGEKRLL